MASDARDSPVAPGSILPAEGIRPWGVLRIWHPEGTQNLGTHARAHGVVSLPHGNTLFYFRAIRAGSRLDLMRVQ